MSTIPQHNSPDSPDRIALAPYNFVPIPNRLVAFPVGEEEQFKLKVANDTYADKHFSGWIDVQLETCSPIYVRGPLVGADFTLAEKQAQPNDKTRHLDKVRNKPHFFHTGDPDDPVIPGSSLRGMLRTMVEIISYSKLTRVSDTNLIYRAAADPTNHGDLYRERLFHIDPTRDHYYTPKFKGGYIRELEDGWYIQPAQTLNETTFARINTQRIPRRLTSWNESENAKTIYIAINNYDFKKVLEGYIHMKRANVTEAFSKPQKRADVHPAVLATSGKIPKKRTELVIFAPDNAVDESDWIRIPSGEDEDERDLVNAYIEQLTPEQKKIVGKKGVLIDNQPILYLLNKDGSLDFFGHTQMFRLPYRRSPREMLPPQHRNEHLIDFAEAMFGRVSKDSATVAGRVFVSDARLLPDQTDIWLPKEPVVIPKILASPKPTTFQHYLTQQSPNNLKELTSYNSAPRDVTLRGNKLYWHRGNVNRDAIKEPEPVNREKDTQHTQMQPVKDGVNFKFRVRFENLKLPEMGMLLWAISLSERGEYRHKIGMGKPLGLGAIKLTPTLTLIDRGERYSAFLNKGDGDQYAMCEGVMTEPQTSVLQTAAVREFKTLIANLAGIKNFEEDDRIQMLLAMLRWPGPDEAKIRYMEIKRPTQQARVGARNTTNRDTVNEYAGRPVLPNPTNV